MENPHEERQSLLLERITKSVHRLNEALLELDQSVVEINNHNQAITIVAELSEAYRRNAAFNLSNMEAVDEDGLSKASMD
ncbi:related to DAD4-outer kinetochore protein (part of Dam1 complex) [Sporisorium reilianum SRZ2]|uniref:DASH complex subunit DAD4 n=1 Tax=Sporisorium reilianum (strain SRZ2) TaxID=999809 RepID=E6ZKE9_SPORE|nr:related to DAD4-outer kinetochore protein (part of Dam1 complex) [Sporisorium reilianum SRZ2]